MWLANNFLLRSSTEYLLSFLKDRIIISWLRKLQCSIGSQKVTSDSKTELVFFSLLIIAAPVAINYCWIICWWRFKYLIQFVFNWLVHLYGGLLLGVLYLTRRSFFWSWVIIKRLDSDWTIALFSFLVRWWINDWVVT